MTAKRQHNRSYTKEFKEDIQLVLEQNYIVSKATESLGITDKILYNWKKKHEEEQSSNVLTKDECSELIRLRKESKRLQMKRDILKNKCLFCQINEVKYSFIRHNKHLFPTLEFK